MEKIEQGFWLTSMFLAAGWDVDPLVDEWTDALRALRERDRRKHLRGSR